MATIKKRKNKFVVIYDYTDDAGKRHQKWETFHTREDAQRRKTEVEFKKATNSFVSPSSQTLSEYLLQWIEIHAKLNWQFNTYTGELSLLKNHVFPILGDIPIQKITPKDIELLYNELQGKKIVKGKYEGVPDEKIPRLSSTTVRHIHTTLKKAFDKAVEWQIISSNPVVCKAPKRAKTERNIWAPETFALVLEDIKDPLLHLSVHLAYVATLRIGETVGITLDCIDLKQGTIHIGKTLQRVSNQALQLIPNDSIIFKFPPRVSGSNSTLILKKPKTDSSDRIVIMTEPLKREIQYRIQHIQKEKAFWGNEYTDYNLLFAQKDGYPIEPKLCEKWFKEWQASTELDLDDLVFHEIRHSSSTYKLELSQGDYKSVQADSGHKNADILLNTYAHSRMASRKKLLKSFEQDFYQNDPSNKNTAEKNTAPSQEEILSAVLKDKELQKKLLLALTASNG